LLGDRRAAFLAGLVFTFSNYHFAHAQGHLNLISMEWVPLFLLGLVRVWRYRRIRDGLLMGTALALTTFCDVYYFLFCGFIAVLAVAVKLVREPRRVFERRVVAAGAAGAALFLVTGGILILAMLVAYWTTEFVPTHDARFWSADLQAFFVPGWISAWGGLFQSIHGRWTGNSAECCQYLGWSVLALSAMAFAFSRSAERPWTWAGLTLTGLVLALGPVLHWGGTIHDGIPLPFKPLSAVLPFLRMSGAPERWAFLSLVGTSVLAGWGLKAILMRLQERRWWRLPSKGVVATGICLLVLIDLAPQWIETREIRWPAFIADLAAQPEEWVFLDLGDDNEALLRQIGHGHRLVGGYISRPTLAAEQFLRRHPVLRSLRGEQPPLPPERLRRESKGLGLRLVIAPQQRLGGLESQGLLRRWSDGWLHVLEIPWEDP
jgi:hypothetical protein